MCGLRWVVGDPAQLLLGERPAVLAAEEIGTIRIHVHRPDPEEQEPYPQADDRVPRGHRLDDLHAGVIEEVQRETDAVFLVLHVPLLSCHHNRNLYCYLSTLLHGVDGKAPETTRRMPRLLPKAGEPRDKPLYDGGVLSFGLGSNSKRIEAHRCFRAGGLRPPRIQAQFHPCWGCHDSPCGDHGVS